MQTTLWAERRAMDSQSDPPGRRRRPPRAEAEPAPVCPICGGQGFVLLDVPMGHPDFGKAVPCSCTMDDRRTRRLHMLERMGTLEMLQRMTFANFIAEPAHLPPEQAFTLRKAMEVAQRFAADPKGWLLLSGSVGSGKTHLAAAIANVRLDAGEPVLFLVVPDLLDHLRATYAAGSEITYDELFEQVRNAPLLILDDLGTQSSTPWAQEKLFQLLNHRYNAQLPTVITTNQRVDDFDARLRSRLLDLQLVIHLQIRAGDFRTGKSAASSELSTLSLHQAQRFDNFNVRRSDLSADERMNLQETVNACLAFADDPQGWLVLAGTYGCGKTHLAAAIANAQVFDKRNEAMFIVTPDLLDHLRATFSPSATTSFDRRFDEIRKTPLLVLDDLGTESASPWAKEKLFQLLNYRYQAMLPTVITTSHTPDEIDPWLRTRMMDVARCRFCGMIVPGYRGSQDQRRTQAPNTRSGRRSTKRE